VPDNQTLGAVGKTAITLEENAICPTNPERDTFDKQRRTAFDRLG
jgi:hypothetical protein